MPDARALSDNGVTDGRRRRAVRRRRALLEAVLLVIGRDGLAVVSQRAVAAEAGLPPSALYRVTGAVRRARV